MNNLSKILSYSTLGTLCAFLIQILSVKLLSMHDYGVIAKWLTDLAFLSIFFVFGLDNSLLYFSKKGKDLFSENFLRNIIFFTIFFVILLIITLLLSQIYYFYLSLACYILAIIQSLNSFNHLNEKFNKYGLINLSKNVFIFIFFGLSFLLGFSFDDNTYIFYYVLMLLFSLTFVIFIGYKPNFKNIKLSFLDKNYFLYGYKSMLNTFLAILLYSTTIYMLDIYLEKESVALFFAATVLSKLAWVIPDSVGNLLYPKFLKIGINYKKNDVINETYFYAQINFLINIFAILGFLFLGELFIELLYGKSYLDIFYLVIILLIGNQGMVYYKILGRYLASLNEWKTQRWALIVAVTSNILLNIFLIERLGVVGAAISTALSFWICGVIMSMKVKGSFIGFINLKNLFWKIFRC